MSMITYDIAPTASRPSGQRSAGRKRKGLLRPGFMEARQRQALQELQRHGLRLPRELEEAGLKISERNEDSLPFVR